MKDLGKILRVTIEYEKGILSLEGKDAKKWKEVADSQALMSNIHGGETPDFKWSIRKKKQNANRNL